MAQISGQRSHQQPSRVIGVVRNARHHLGPAEALRIFKRSVRNQLAGFEIHQPKHDRGGAQVHRNAVNRPGRAVYLDAIDQDAVSVPGYRRVELNLRISKPGACRSICICPRRIVWQRTCPPAPVTKV